MEFQRILLRLRQPSTIAEDKVFYPVSKFHQPGTRDKK